MNTYASVRSRSIAAHLTTQNQHQILLVSYSVYTLIKDEFDFAKLQGLSPSAVSSGRAFPLRNRIGRTWRALKGSSKYGPYRAGCFPCAVRTCLKRSSSVWEKARYCFPYDRSMRRALFNFSTYFIRTCPCNVIWMSSQPDLPNAKGSQPKIYV